MFTSPLSKLKSRVKNGDEVTLNVPSNVTGDSHDEANFPYKLLLTDMQVLSFGQGFVNNSSAIIKL